MKRQFLNLFCGLSFGGLVGIIIGLSISEVVGIVLGALTSVLVTFFGLKDQAVAGMVSSRILIAGFGISCIAGLLIGLYLRTHDALSPSVEYYLNDLKKLNLDSSSLKKIVLLKRYGIELKSEQSKDPVQDYAIDTTKSKDAKAKKKTTVLASLIDGSRISSTTLYNAKDSKNAAQIVSQKYANYTLDQLKKFLYSEGQPYEQFYNNVAEVKDTAIQKNIIIQLIAITYDYSKN